MRKKVNPDFPAPTVNNLGALEKAVQESLSDLEAIAKNKDLKKDKRRNKQKKVESELDKRIEKIDGPFPYLSRKPGTLLFKSFYFSYPGDGSFESRYFLLNGGNYCQQINLIVYYNGNAKLEPIEGGIKLMGTERIGSFKDIMRDLKKIAAAFSPEEKPEEIPFRVTQNNTEEFLKLLKGFNEHAEYKTVSLSKDSLDKFLQDMLAVSAVAHGILSLFKHVRLPKNKERLRLKAIVQVLEINKEKERLRRLEEAKKASKE